MQNSQPRSLTLLFFTELWERFGFYALQTILILYMSHGLHYSDHEAYLLYGAFSSMVYLTPVLGGYVADKFLGHKWSIILGGILLTLGYSITAIPASFCFFLGLSIVIIGNGFFKPNVSSLVGDLYTKQDPRREGGFTLFYMGINIGSLIPPLISGGVVALFGWHAGFLLAAIGMVIGLFTFLSGRHRIQKIGLVPASSPLSQASRPRKRFFFFLGVSILFSIFFFRLIFYFPLQTDIFLATACILILLYLILKIIKEKRMERSKLIACLILIVISIGFWAIYNQTFSSLTLFADRNMKKELLGFTIDAEFMQFFNAFFILALSPILSKVWLKLEQRKKNPSTPLKFSLGILGIAAGFFFLSYGIRHFSAEGIASPWWLIGSYFLQTVGELLLSPIGLSMITLLSPKHMVGTMMGIWFLSISASFAISAGLAFFATIPANTSVEASLEIYAHAFNIYGGIALIVSLASFSLIPLLRRLIQGSPPMNPIH